MLTAQNVMVQGTVKDMPSVWCVAEYMVMTPDSELPVSIFITATALRDAFTFAEGQRNSEWRNIAHPDYPIGVHIICTGTKPECLNEANRIIMARNPRPRCNIYGYNSLNARRPIECNNGKVYETQAEACRELNLNGSQVSRQLKGELRSVKGFVFRYKDR